MAESTHTLQWVTISPKIAHYHAGDLDPLNFLLFVSEYLILFLHTFSVAIHHFWQ